MDPVTAYIRLEHISLKPFPKVKVKKEGSKIYHISSDISLAQLLGHNYSFGQTSGSIDFIVVRDGKREAKRIEVKEPIDAEAIKKELEALAPSSSRKWGIAALLLLSITAAAYVKRDLIQSGLAKFTS